MTPLPHHEVLTNRRDFLRRGGAGFGALALSYLLGENPLNAALGDEGGQPGSPMSAKLAHRMGKAKSVIFLFMEGGPSHLDTFDPKPLLQQLHGQELPPSFGQVITAMGESRSPLLADKRQWKQHGESGMWVSDWLPHTAKLADELCVIRSCVSDGINHAGGVCQMNTGSIFGGRPSLGSWVNYGLGTQNQNLPAFVVLKDSDSQVVNGVRNWGSGFMPAVYQGVQFEPDGTPIANLTTPKGMSEPRQRAKLDFLSKMNTRYGQPRQDNSQLDARIKAYELAFRMQAEAPDAVDLAKESEATKKLYGLDDSKTAVFGRNCLLARRLVERGVRFVQLYSGAGSKWDSHSKIEENHGRLFGQTDKPIAGLLMDLKSRGLLDETLVIWGGEFGRTPMSEGGTGRDHNPTGFTMWMAGGGIKGGQVIGSTDELGLRAVDQKMHVHDLHATILHLMGVDHTRLIYKYKGRPERIDQNEGHAFTKMQMA
ncbi:DUF1501 domain-containing protein [Prosthecobacter sp. SYSU 5D2]|uniref:DUF1501 domain-containing protein n=1 Tax=Prosthecobacter sp. SYSU 5D2 TaxID=3134134 RepID=UPI0031FEFB3B